LFIGDSHAEQYNPRIDKLFLDHPDQSKGILFVTQRGCLPISELKGITYPKCKGFAENARAMAERSDVETIVMVAAWNRYDDILGSKDGEKAFQDLAASLAAFKKMGHRVYLVLAIPRGEAFDPAGLVKRSILDLGFVVQQRVDRATADASVESVSSRLVQIAASTGATVIDPVPAVCGNDYCPTLAGDGLPVYIDNSHLRPAYVREHITFLDSIVTAN
jgi:hypothetical protein